MSMPWRLPFRLPDRSSARRGRLANQLDQRPQLRWDVAVARMVEAQAGKGRRPLGQHAHQAAGGESPALILDDADLATAVPLAVAAGFQNSGQACIAGSHIPVPAAKLGEVAILVEAAVAAIKLGDPRDPATAIGPMVSQKQWDRVQRYIRLGLAEGARLLVGGEGKPPGLEDGRFVRPTVFVGVDNGMTIAREEIFGPVLAILAWRSGDEAIANDTDYGLQAYVLSADPVRARARRVRSRGLP